jgi:ATP-dependent DNA ligase
MEARLVDTLPTGRDLQYEPKWDGFRCLAFWDGSTVDLRSKASKPLTRYFPDVATAIAALGASRCVLDGELVVPEKNMLSFDQLLQRIHPAASRVLALATSHPALYIVFDILVDTRGKSLVRLPLSERRERLETFAAANLTRQDPRRPPAVILSPMTRDVRRVRAWLRAGRGGLDGVVAKCTDLPYQAGTRDGMQKVKQYRTADCVVGGFRYATKPQAGRRVVGSLLLGLYDNAGLLHHIGFTSALSSADRVSLTRRLERLIKPPGFTGQAPGGPSRWSTERTSDWEPLAPSLVVEVTYDHFSDGRFRHGTGLVRWRPDKAPRQCTFEQIAPAGRSSLELLRRRGTRRRSPPRRHV